MRFFSLALPINSAWLNWRLFKQSQSEADATVSRKLSYKIASAAAQACLAFTLLSYPTFLHFGAHNGAQSAAAKDQFDFCRLFAGEPALSCALASRLIVREVQAAAGDARACAQASTMSKFFLHPWRSGTWDKTALALYANYYESSERFSKRLKARLAKFMLSKHHEIDEQCGTIPPDYNYTIDWPPP